MKKFQQISCQDAKKKLAAEQLIVMDIRDAITFASGHVPNAVNIDKNDLTNFVENAHKNIPIIVCCYHGFSSQPVAQYLIDKGFTEVYSLEGGYAGWN